MRKVNRTLPYLSSSALRCFAIRTIEQVKLNVCRPKCLTYAQPGIINGHSFLPFMEYDVTQERFRYDPAKPYVDPDGLPSLSAKQKKVLKVRRKVLGTCTDSLLILLLLSPSPLSFSSLLLLSLSPLSFSPSFSFSSSFSFYSLTRLKHGLMEPTPGMGKARPSSGTASAVPRWKWQAEEARDDTHDQRVQHRAGARDGLFLRLFFM